jgi:hypothetical protein
MPKDAWKPCQLVGFCEGAGYLGHIGHVFQSLHRVDEHRGLCGTDEGCGNPSELGAHFFPGKGIA